MNIQYSGISLMAGLVFALGSVVLSMPAAAQQGQYLVAQDEPDRDQTRDRDRLRDQSCEEQKELKEDCKDQLRDRDRDQDQDRDKERIHQ